MIIYNSTSTINSIILVKNGIFDKFNQPFGIAIHGYDAVAYFRAGRPERGRDDYAIIWKGAVWRFASAENLRRFEANPRAYAPQFGGYCAYSVSKGHVSTGDPAAWEIVEGRLYLTNSPNVHRLWARDKARALFRDILLSQPCRERGLFDTAAVERLLDQEAPYGRRLWGLLNIELWHRQFIDAA